MDGKVKALKNFIRNIFIKKPESNIFYDEKMLADGAYFVTFDNGEETLCFVKNGELCISKFLVKGTMPRIKGHKPIKFERI